MHFTVPVRLRPRDIFLCLVTSLATVILTLSAIVIIVWAYTAWPIIGATSTEIETPSVVSAKDIEAFFPPQHSPAGTVKILATMPGPNGVTLFTVGLTNGETRTATSTSPNLKVGDVAAASVVVYPNNGQYTHAWVVAAVTQAEGPKQ